jgi:ligand-binding sensor domain-containing protein/serine phosphatase RsbU (regulator of sigma subunit)
MRHYRAIILLFFMGIGCLSNAQSPYFEILKNVKDKKNFQNNVVFQDSRGFLWIGSTLGLTCYNGFSPTMYTAREGLSDNVITALGEDHDKQLWIGHKSGKIDILRHGVFTAFSPEEGLSTSEVSTLLFDANNTAWFSTLGEGIYYFKGANRKRLYNLNTDDGLCDNFVYSMVVSPDGKIYVGTDKGICIVDPLRCKVVSYLSMKDGLPDNIVRHLYFDKSGLLWIGMEEAGLCSYNIKAKTFQNFSKWNFGTLNTFIERHPGEFWVSTASEGVVKVSFRMGAEPMFKQYKTEQGLHCNRTREIFLDREHNVWIGCQDGVTKSASNRFEFIDKRDGFDVHNIYSFILDKHNHYWIASENGLFRYTLLHDGLLEKKQLITQPPLANSFVSLYEDNEGFVWAGTYGYGAYRFDTETLTFTHYGLHNGLPNDNVISISGKDSVVWFSTLGGGAVSCNLKEKMRFTTYDLTNGLSGNYVYSIFTDSHGNVWFAHDGKGFSVLQNGVMRKAFFPDSLSDNTVYSITEDKLKNIWFLTASKGLICYNGKHFTSLNESNGLRTNSVRSIIPDCNNNLIIVSNEGIDFYDPLHHTFDYHGEDDGVAFLEPNLNAAITDQKGDIWIGARNGVVQIRLLNKEEDKITPKILITRRMLFFNDIAGDYNFNYKQNHLSFEYIGLWYRSPGNLQYRYKLDHYDIGWSNNTSSRLVTYSNLPPGKYVFRVEVSNRPGVWIGSDDAVFAFCIKPPFWETWWFIILSILVIVLGIYLYIKFRIASLERAKDILEDEVRKRTALIYQQKEEIETQRDEIEQQRDYVIEQRDRIALQNLHITDSINYASRIQQVLLPSDGMFAQMLTDYFILYRPMNIVSGDFYWIGTKQNKTIVIAADCTGHGVPGALMSMLGISYINEIFNSSGGDISASDYMEFIREKIKFSLRQTGGEGENNDTIDASLIVINDTFTELQFAGANNPLCLVRNNEITVFKSDSMSLGISYGEHRFNQQIIPLQKDDCIYMFSDGYSDQLGGPRDSKFKSRNFYELLRSIHQAPMKEQKEILHQTMNDWKANDAQNDDILVIGIRI